MSALLPLAGAFAVALAAGLARAARRRRAAPEYVIGAELARARAAEERHRAREGAAPSPLEGREYRTDAGRLSDPAVVPFDLHLRDLCRAYAAADAASRARTRDALAQEDFRTLLHFSRRASVFAIRQRDAAWAADALTAVAMVELERIERGDVTWGLVLPYHAARRVGADPAALYARAAALAEPAVAALLDDCVRLGYGERGVAASYYAEVETGNGVGFVRRGWAPDYAPTLELARAALDLERLFPPEGYTESEPWVAAAFPPERLADGGRDPLPTLAGSRGAAAFLAFRLGPGGEVPAEDAQTLSATVLEARDEAAARELEAIAALRGGRRFARLGVARGRLFALLVAEPFIPRVPAEETDDTLARFAGPVARVLERYAEPPREGESDGLSTRR